MELHRVTSIIIQQIKSIHLMSMITPEAYI